MYGSRDILSNIEIGGRPRTLLRRFNGRPITAKIILGGFIIMVYFLTLRCRALSQ